MKHAEPLILIRSDTYADEDMRRAIREIAPGARVATDEDVDNAPGLFERVEVCLGRLPGEDLPKANALRWMHTTNAGSDWATRPEWRAHPVTITNSRIHAAPICEQLFGMLFALTRALDFSLRKQQERRWDRPPHDRLLCMFGKTLCVLGLGNIGRHCAKVGHAFGMRVVGVRRTPKETPFVEEVHPPERIREAVAGADVVMAILPGVEDTRGIINAGVFAAMKPGAHFLNAGRGATVVTDALVEALREGRLAGAGLDVTDPEPLPPDHPLWGLPNVIITPHDSGTFVGYNAEVRKQFLANLRRWVNGEPLELVVDKEAGY